MTGDPRLRPYADILLDTCLGVQPGWQVLVHGTPLARPLIDELTRGLAVRDVYALLRLTFDGDFGPARLWVEGASTERLGVIAPIEAHALDTADAMIGIRAPENIADASTVDSERRAAVGAAYRPHTLRMLGHEIPWVVCQYPTPALAQEAGMSTEAFADFLYGACLLDWGAERERMQRYADRFERADEVRIVGAGTDLRMSIAGRPMRVDAGGANMPGGEVFCCPVDGTVEGVIAFTEFPAVYLGHRVSGIRLRFEGGRVVDASADAEEEFLVACLDRDEGARALGELGIGCNPGITRYMGNTGFDEKMDGTVHVALGAAFPDLGGTNVSSLHWDIVKDLRVAGSRIELDGETVQQDGRWLL